MRKLLRYSKENKLPKSILLACGFVLLVIVSYLSLTLGRVHIPAQDVINVLIGKGASSRYEYILLNLRLPRLLGAIMVGAALSTSGTVYQSVFQNPLVSPDLLGVSSGACFGAAISIVLGLSDYFITSISFVSGLVCVLLCISLSFLTKQRSNLMLVFSGIIVGKFMDSFVGIIKYFADPESQLGDIVNWQLGTLSKVTMDNIYIMAPLIIICLFIVILMRWRVNVLSMGEKEAMALGINPVVDRIALIIVATLLTATSVCFCGTISWVGLIVPHITRQLVGSDNRYALPCGVVLGSTFLVVCDLLARTLTDYELPLGVITGLCGAPIFAFILIKKARKAV